MNWIIHSGEKRSYLQCQSYLDCIYRQELLTRKLPVNSSFIFFSSSIPENNRQEGLLHFFFFSFFPEAVWWISVKNTKSCDLTLSPGEAAALIENKAVVDGNLGGKADRNVPRCLLKGMEATCSCFVSCSGPWLEQKLEASLVPCLLVAGTKMLLWVSASQQWRFWAGPSEWEFCSSTCSPGEGLGTKSSGRRTAGQADHLCECGLSSCNAPPGQKCHFISDDLFRLKDSLRKKSPYPSPAFPPRLQPWGDLAEIQPRANSAHAEALLLPPNRHRCNLFSK